MALSTLMSYTRVLPNINLPMRQRKNRKRDYSSGRTLQGRMPENWEDENSDFEDSEFENLDFENSELEDSEPRKFRGKKIQSMENRSPAVYIKPFFIF